MKCLVYGLLDLKKRLFFLGPNLSYRIVKVIFFFTYKLYVHFNPFGMQTSIKSIKSLSWNKHNKRKTKRSLSIANFIFDFLCRIYFRYEFQAVDSLLFKGYLFLWISLVKVNHKFFLNPRKFVSKKINEPLIFHTVSFTSVAARTLW